MACLEIVAEYARTGRSSCKSCSASIPNKGLRLGLPYHDSTRTKWYHFGCFPHPVYSSDLITGFNSLEVWDKKALSKLAAAFQSSARTREREFENEQVGLHEGSSKRSKFVVEQLNQHVDLEIGGTNFQQQQQQQQPRVQASTDVLTQVLAGLQQIQQTLDPLAHGLPEAQARTDVMTQTLAVVDRIQQTLDHLARGIPVQQIIEPMVEPPEQQPIPSQPPPPVLSKTGVQTQVPSRLEKDTISPILTSFLELEPPSFQGEIDDDPYEFIDALENRFEVLSCTDAEKVELAAIKLGGRAATWWDGYVYRVDFSWEEFKRALVKFMLPQSVLKRHADEFNKFRQEPTMSMTEYEERFNKLCRYVLDESLSESVRMRKFKGGLLPCFAPYVAAGEFQTVAQIAQAARVIESVFFQNP